MPEALPCLHHVVFSVEPEHQDAAATFWTEIGFEFIEIVLSDVGLRVLLDWNGGIEIISPTDPVVGEGARVRRFLDESGEGVYSIVVQTGDIEGPLSVASRYGANPLIRHDRGGDGFELEETMLNPVYGMPITFITTDLKL
jgi:hypothetical protein